MGLTKSQLKFVQKRHSSGDGWAIITTEFNKKFQAKASGNSLRHQYRAQFDGTVPKVERKAAETPAEPHPYQSFTKEALGQIIKENDIKKGRFFITAAAPITQVDYSDSELADIKAGKIVVGGNLHKEGFSAVQNFCKRMDAELIILPMPAHVKALKEQPRHYDPLLMPFLKHFATEYTFNEHLKAFEAYINPQQINPLTGLKRLRVFKNSVQGEEIKRFKTSLIIAHAKQMMEVVPTGINTTPRIIHSTGSITKPAYLRNRIGMIAQEDHKLGGLIVEIDGDRFYIRQVQFNPENGSFVDLSTRYHANGSTSFERAEGFKMGDLHPGHEDKDALAVWEQVWDITQPKKIFLEDAYDASSSSHHMERANITRARLPEYFRSIEAEIKMAREVLDNVRARAPKDSELVMTASNHNEHLDRYLEEGRYLKDDANFEIAHRMVVMKLDGKDPLQEYLDPQKKMTWTDRNEDVFVEGVQMGAHGDIGLNGARSSKQGQELAYGNAVVGHSHTPGIYHDLYVVGHSSHARHGYNRGPSTWLLASALVYKGGMKQMIIAVKGTKDKSVSWKLENKSSKREKTTKFHKEAMKTAGKAKKLLAK